jgi:hypothetical protein
MAVGLLPTTFGDDRVGGGCGAKLRATKRSRHADACGCATAASVPPDTDRLERFVRAA